MAWSDTSPEVWQALKEQKAVLSRLTPNRAAAAEIIGVRPSTVERWCDVRQMNPLFPLALVSRHPEAVQLLEIHAYKVGHTLVPLEDAGRLDGMVDDELRGSMTHLGQVAEEVQQALRGLQTPNKIDPQEAQQILGTVRSLQQDLVKMVGELSAMIEGQL